MEPVCEVTPQGPSLNGKPTAEVHLLPWTWKHVAAYLLETCAGGKQVLDEDVLRDLARYKVLDEFEGGVFVLTSKRIEGPL